MERREELQSEQAAQLSRIDELQSELSDAQAARDEALVADRPVASTEAVSRRDRAGRVARRRPGGDLRASARPRRPGAGAAAGRAGAVPAASRSTGARWRGSPPPPRTRCCAAPSAAQSCCGTRESGAVKVDRRGRRWIARQPRARGLRRGGVVGRPRAGAGRAQGGDRHRHQQRRRISRSDRGSGGGRRDRRHRRRRIDGLQAGGRADVGPVARQASRPDSACTSGPGSWPASSTASRYAWIPREQELARRPAGQRGHGRRSRAEAEQSAEDRKPLRRRSPRRAGRARAARRPGCCCCATGRPSCRSQRRYSGRGNPPLTELGPQSGRRRRAVSGRARRHRRRSSARRCSAPTTPRRRRPRRWASTSPSTTTSSRPTSATWEGLTFGEAARTGSGAARPVAARHQPGAARTARASTPSHSGCGGRATGSSPSTATRPCWWCRT